VKAESTEFGKRVFKVYKCKWRSRLKI
jgi:hypothetical protein